MARRIGEAVAVRVSEHPDAGQSTAVQAPASFIWRDRVYVVREVLGYWRERRAWWSGAAARAVHGDAEVRTGSSRPAGVDGSVGGSGPAGEAVATGGYPEPGLRVAIDHEREVWRVEARGPRTVGTGVYDICRESSELPGEQTPAWHLLAVAD